MDDQLHNDDLLIRYLDGELSVVEATQLEQRLRFEKGLQERLTKLRVAVQAIRHLGTVQQVNAIHGEMMKERSPRHNTKVPQFRRGIRYAMGIAAGLLLLVVGVRLYQSAQLSNEKLYSQTFVDFNVSASRSSNAKASAIETHYREKAYESVISSVRSFRLDAKDSLLVGLSYLQTAHANQAIHIFQRLAAGENDYRQDAEFYLSLAYLKTNDAGRALPLMQKINANPAHLYHEQISADLLENVKKLHEK